MSQTKLQHAQSSLWTFVGVGAGMFFGMAVADYPTLFAYAAIYVAFGFLYWGGKVLWLRGKASD